MTKRKSRSGWFDDTLEKIEVASKRKVVLPLKEAKKRLLADLRDQGKLNE